MGRFSCCFGGSKTKEDDVLLPWAPLPADMQLPAARQQRSSGGWGWRPAGGTGGGSPAPAFGEGALREDEWAPKFQLNYKRRSGQFAYSTLSDVPPAPAPAWPAKPAPTPSPPAPVVAAPKPSPPAGGWGSEPDWVRQQALALAEETSTSRPGSAGSGGNGGGGGKLSKLFTRQPHAPVSRGAESDDGTGLGGGSPPALPSAQKKQARAGGRARQKGRGGGQEGLLPHAPAFGEGALHKWH